MDIYLRQNRPAWPSC